MEEVASATLRTGSKCCKSIGIFLSSLPLLQRYSIRGHFKTQISLMVSSLSRPKVSQHKPMISTNSDLSANHRTPEPELPPFTFHPRRPSSPIVFVERRSRMNRINQSINIASIHPTPPYTQSQPSCNMRPDRPHYYWTLYPFGILSRFQVSALRARIREATGAWEVTSTRTHTHKGHLA